MLNNFFTENLGTIIVSAVLIVAVGLIIARLIINKKKGKHACPYCPSASTCPACKGKDGGKSCCEKNEES
ncbi:MAG: FeoB-associated Cys-rich membrane protein [Christensenellaceae bacterium]|jgi:hypothetical protein|nr:FeoB-associated Cys-rich membrane protein [Christensenellaceae bacterium]